MTRAIRAAWCAAGAHSSLQSVRVCLRVGTWRAVTPSRALARGLPSLRSRRSCGQEVRGNGQTHRHSHLPLAPPPLCPA
jgi:hypothetical protein